MADIFISYASEDRERIRPLVDHLQKLGWSVWWDRELVAGPSFDEKIEQAIREASCVVVAWSEAATHSRWVRDEANEGLERDILVPVLLDNVRPPMGFRSSHAANLIGWPERRPETELNSLITGIRDLVGTTGHQREIIDSVISSRSIAVLRFADMTAERDRGFLCEGIAEEILNKLARIRDLKVIARTSSFQFDPTDANIREIGRQLGVHHVLEGSVRIAGNQVRITAQLIECASESHRWSESYTRELVDLFTLYDEVAEAIARELDIAISDTRPKSLTAPTRSEEALRLVMQAQFKYMETGNPRASLPLAEQALALDPNYAEAHAQKGALLYLHAEGGFEPPEPHLLGARESLERALALDPNHGNAHWFKAVLHAALDLDFTVAAEAMRESERVVGYRQRYWLLGWAGHPEEALAECMDAMERDPLHFLPRIWAGMSLDSLGRPEEASEQFNQAVEVAPRHMLVFQTFVRHLTDIAKDPDAAELFLAETKYTGGLLRWARAHIAHVQGDSEPLRKLVEDWVANRDTRWVQANAIASGYFDLGDYESYIRWFAIREQEKDNLGMVAFEISRKPMHWERLTAWAIEDPAEARSRMALFNEHRERIDRITRKLVLPSDFVAETVIGTTRS